jgi:hypothetical protein
MCSKTTINRIELNEDTDKQRLAQAIVDNVSSDWWSDFMDILQKAAFKKIDEEFSYKRSELLVDLNFINLFDDDFWENL